VEKLDLSKMNNIQIEWMRESEKIYFRSQIIWKNMLDIPITKQKKSSVENFLRMKMQEILKMEQWNERGGEPFYSLKWEFHLDFFNEGKEVGNRIREMMWFNKKSQSVKNDFKRKIFYKALLGTYFVTSNLKMSLSRYCSRN